MITWFLSFEFVCVVDSIDGFPYIEPSLPPWDEAYLIMVNDGFDVFLDSVCKNFIEYICINIQKQDCPEVLSFGWVLVWFRYQSNYGFIELVRQCTFCFYFME